MTKQIIRDGLRVIGTDFVEIPYGTTAQRGAPTVSGVRAAIRVSASTGKLEWYAQQRAGWSSVFEPQATLTETVLTNLSGTVPLEKDNYYRINGLGGTDIKLTINTDNWTSGDSALIETDGSDFVTSNVRIVKQDATVDFVLNTITTNNVYPPNSKEGKRIRLASSNAVYVLKCLSPNIFSLESINQDDMLSIGRLTVPVTDGMELKPDVINVIKFGTLATLPPAGVKLPDSNLSELEDGTVITLAVEALAVRPLMADLSAMVIEAQGADKIGARGNSYFLPPNINIITFTLMSGIWQPNIIPQVNFEASAAGDYYSLDYRDVGWNFIHNSTFVTDTLKLPAEHSFGMAWIHGDHSQPTELVDNVVDVKVIGGAYYRSDVGVVDAGAGADIAIKLSIPMFSAELEAKVGSQTNVTWRSSKPLFRRFKNNTDLGFLEVMPSPKTTFVHGTEDGITLSLVKDRDSHGWVNGDELHIINHKGANITIDTKGTSVTSGLNVRDENLVQDTPPIAMAQKGLVVLMYADNEFIVKYRGYYGI